MKDNWYEVRPRTSAQVEEAFEYLKRIFDPSWVRSYKGELIENIFLRSILYDRSAFTRNHLITLSEQLKRHEETSGIHVVIRGLRGKQESDAANMELELADYLAQEGYQVEFPVAKSAKGKSPDIRLTKGDGKYAVECKGLRVSEIESWLNGVFQIASSQLMALAETNGLGIEFIFSAEVVRGLLERRNSGVAVADAASDLLKRISEEIDVAINRNRWPLWMWIDKRGSGFFFKANSTVGSSVGTPGMPDELVFRRLIQNAVVPAAKQLSNEEMPGLIAIHTREIPSDSYLAQELNRFLFENRDDYEHILAVLILPWQGWFQRNQPRLIVNRHAQHEWNNSGISGAIAKYDPIILP